MLDIRRLRVLRELERQHTVTAAAASLHMSPSAVSQQLALLSQEVGCPVIEREGRNVRLTMAARILLEHATSLFAQMESLEADLHNHQSGDVGVVRISSFQTAASAIVVPAAAALAGTRPRLEIRLVQMDAPRSFDELAAGRLDIAVSVEYVGSPPTADVRFTRIPLLRDKFSALLPAHHRCASKKTVALSELSEDPWISNLPGSPCHFITMAACASAGFSPRVRHAVDDWTIMLDMVSAGMGVGLIPGLARPPVREDAAIRPLSEPGAARNLFALVRRGTEEAPTIAAVLSAMKATQAD